MTFLLVFIVIMPLSCTIFQCYEHVVKHNLAWLGLFQFFHLRLSLAHSRDQPAPSRLAVSWLAGQDHETWLVTRPRDSWSPVYSRQNELRSRWGKNGVFCQLNCTCFELTSLTAVAAWTPVCSRTTMVGAVVDGSSPHNEPHPLRRDRVAADVWLSQVHYVSSFKILVSRYISF